MKNIKKGFTLIELLVVVLIIGILASVGIPSYFKTVETAKANDAVAMTSMIGAAYRMFLVDNPGVFLTGTIADGCNGATCATLGANDVCRLVACNYVAPQDWGNNAYSYTLGGANRDCTSDRKGGTYDAWGYNFNSIGACTANGGAPSCPKM